MDGVDLESNMLVESEPTSDGLWVVRDCVMYAFVVLFSSSFGFVFLFCANTNCALGFSRASPDWYAKVERGAVRLVTGAAVMKRNNV